MKDIWKGFYSLILATFLYSFFGVFTKTIGFELGVFYGAWIRCLMCAAVLFPFLYCRNSWISVRHRDWIWIIARGAAGSLFAFVLNYYSFYYLPLGTALFIFYAGSTIGGYLLGRLLFQEHLNTVKTISLILSMIGLGTIYLVNFKIADPFYMTLALAGGISTAVWNTLSKKISYEYPPVQLNFLDMVFAAVFFFVGFLVTNERWVPIELNTVWVTNSLFALMFLLTGQLIVWGFKYLDAQIASIIMLGEIIFGIALGWLFYREHPTIYTLVGGIIIFIAIMYPEVSLLYQRKQKGR